MAKQEKTIAGAPTFKKGSVTIDGVNFNDEWARKLKPQEIDGKTISAEDQFIAEFPHHFTDLAEAERVDLLKKAFSACLSAE